MLIVRTQFGSATGTPWLSTMAFGGSSADDAQDAAEAVRAFWDSLKNYISDTVSCNDTGLVDVVNEATGEKTGEWTVDVPAVLCNDSAQALPWATQGLISWRTGVFYSGRQVLGRTFIPGPTEASNEGGHMTSTYSGVLLSSAGTLAAATIPFHVYSRTHHALCEVKAWRVPQPWSVLRSRRD